MAFTIKIEPEAEQDIQEGINWYIEQQVELGRKFHSTVKTCINDLKMNPFYQIRYDNVRCLPVDKYPYMIHFTVNDKLKEIIIHAVINTHRSPDIWKDRSKTD